MGQKPRHATFISAPQGEFMTDRRLRIVRNPSGQGLTEYLILLVLVAVLSIGVVKALGERIKTRFDQSKEKIEKDVNV